MSIPGLKTTVPDEIGLKVSLALLLCDQFTNNRKLAGSVLVTLVNTSLPARYIPHSKEGEGTYYLVSLPNGDYNLEARSKELHPLYQPLDIPVSIPFKDANVDQKWPAYPNLAIADKTKPLDDASQPAQYREQRARSLLKPSIYYPFPSDATLIRGRVVQKEKPIANVTVKLEEKDNPYPSSYVTDVDGQYVLFVRKMSGLKQEMKLIVAKQGLAPVSIQVIVRRSQTIMQDIALS
jgi:hypothetical protein